MKKVMCVDDGAQITPRVVKGIVYEVEEENKDSYRLVGIRSGWPGGWFGRMRFVDWVKIPAGVAEHLTQSTITIPPPFDFDAYNGFSKRG